MNTTDEVPVWDLFVRGFHWALVVAFILSYLTDDDYLTLHSWAGYAALALVALRLPWGVIGTRHARFTRFVRPPRAAWGYVRALMSGRAPRYLGHNPAGGLMIVALLLLIPIVSVTGMAALAAEEHTGPLVDLMAQSPRWLNKVMEDVHELFANVAAALVVIHVGGVLVESLLHRENLVRAMFTGRKRRRTGDVE